MALPSSCITQNGVTSCPASFTFNFAQNGGKLEAHLTCPVEYASSLDVFRTATQEGKCECTDTVRFPDVRPMDCECYACPKGSTFGTAHICKQPIFGECFSVNCAGVCNGTPDFEAFLPEVALPEPTLAPVQVSNPTVSPIAANSLPPVEKELCQVVDGEHVCTLDANLDELQGWPALLQASLRCPVEAVQEANGDIREATHRGLCDCETDLLRIGRSNIDEDPIDCQCYICPEGSAVDHAYECNKALSGDCKILNCDGVCNGPLDFLASPQEPAVPSEESTDNGTESSSSEEGGSSAMASLRSRLTLGLVVALCLFSS